MRDTPLPNRIFQRLNDMILAQNVVEYLGAIFSREDLVTHSDNLVSCARRGQDLKVLSFGFWVIGRPRTFKTQNSKLFSSRALFPFTALVCLFCDRYDLLGRHYRARTRKFHRRDENRNRESGLGALPIFQKDGSGGRNESGRSG